MQFRFKALQRMREPDELDTVILLAKPRGWIATFVVLIVVASACVWAFVGQIPRTLTTGGLLTHPLGVSQLQSIYTGQVSQLNVAPQETVAVGQTVMKVTDSAGKTHPIRSPFAGTIISVSIAAGQVVTAGTTLLTVERTDSPGDHLLAMVFVPANQALGVRPGDPVDISVASDPAAVFGLLRGRVTSVSPYPLTRQALETLLGGNLAVRNYVSVTDPQLVVVDLVRDPHTASGYAWTSVAGPPGAVRSQVAVTAAINLGTERPINLVLGR